MNANPVVDYTTSTSEICYNDPARLDFNISAGSPPFSVDYSIKGWGDFLEDDINVSKLGVLQKEAVFIAQEVGYK